MLLALGANGILFALFGRLGLGGANNNGLVDKCVEAEALSCVTCGDEDEGDREEARSGSDAQKSPGDDEGDCGSVDWRGRDKVSVCDGGKGVSASGVIAEAGRAVVFGRGEVGILRSAS